MSPEGLVKIEDLKFGIVHWDGSWKHTSQLSNPATLTYLGEGGISEKYGICRNGSFHLANGSVFDYAETVNRKSGTEVDFGFVLSSPEGIDTKIAVYQTLMPRIMYKNNPVIFNGEKITVDNNQITKKGKANGELLFKLKKGTLSIRGNFTVTVKENNWGVDVRLHFKTAYGKVRRTALNIRMTYIPYHATAINLTKAMNMGFSDQVADDRQGGWTDQGPENDLSDMKSGNQIMGGIPFDIADPALNDGKSCIAIKGKQRPYFVEQSTVEVPALSGEYLYLLNALAWAPPRKTVCGKITVTYDDRSAKDFFLRSGVDTGDFWHPVDIKNALVAWTHTNGSADIGLYSTKIPLDQTKKVIRLKFGSTGQVWMVLAATISNMLQESQTNENKLVMKPDELWLPCNFEFTTVKNSVIDFSVFADAPAGKYGFLQPGKAGVFEFERRKGIPVRFWGTNICFDTQYMSEDRTLTMLDDISAMGYNSIRLHHFDGKLMTDALELDSGNMRKLDFLVSEAQKRGIYITLDLYTYRRVKELEKFGVLSPTEYKTLCYFDEDAYQSLLGFAKKLFGHRNEFTGKLWKDAPTIALLNFVNEGTLSVNAKRMSPRVESIVEAAFIKYAEQHNLVLDQENRGRHFDDFLVYAGKNFFLRLKKELMDFGLKIPCSDQNFARPAYDTRAVYDYVDSHLYWGHPKYLGNKPSRPPVFVNSASAIASSAGGINSMFFSRIMDRPLTVTEWNYCYPNPHNMEGPFLAAAYSALQGYNGLWQFAYSHSGKVGEKLSLGSFDYECNPVMKQAVRAGALLFRRGDVRTARTAVAELRTKDKELLAPRRLGLILKTGIVFSTEKTGSAINAVIASQETDSIDKSVSCPIVRADNEEQALRKLIELKLIKPDCVDFAKNIVRSETGELEISRKQKKMTMLTPRSEAFIMPEKTTGKGRFMKVHNKLSFAAFFAGSLDGAELGKSRRIIILHLTDFKNEGAIFKDKSMSILESFGTPGKYLIRRGEADISLKHPSARHLYACAANGKRLSEIKFRRSGDTIGFSADTASCEGGVFIYELTE